MGRQLTEVINLGREIQKIKNQTSKVTRYKGGQIKGGRNKGSNAMKFVRDQSSPHASYVLPANLMTKFKLSKIKNQFKYKPTECRVENFVIVQKLAITSRILRIPTEHV